MRVLALDPGYDRLGVAILEKTSAKETLLFSSCITTQKSDSFVERLSFIGTSVEKLIVDYSPTCIGIETLFFNKNTKTALGVAEVRGVCLFLAKKHECAVYEFSPQEIKVATTGYGKSDKSAVIAMVKRLVRNAPQKALDDEYDAIAVGITTLAIHGLK